MKRTKKADPGKKITRQMRARAARRREEPEPEREMVWTPDRLVPSGCILINLLCSDSIHGAWPLGRITTMPGGSASGKTLLALSTLAACCHEDRFDDYHLIHDDSENRQDFDIAYLFGDALAERLEGAPLASPDHDHDLGSSDTIEDLENNIATLLKKEEPFIYIADSLDALTTIEELDKQQAQAMQAAKSSDDVKKIADAFAGRKAGLIGQMLRRIKKSLSSSNSALIITQQLRVNMNAGAWGKKYRTSGGEAPYFYSHVRPMLAKVKTHKKGKPPIPIGVRTKATTDKNSITGKIREIEFDTFYDLGIDDVGSTIDWLTNVAKHWPKSKQTIKARGLGLTGTRAKLIEDIEDGDLEGDLAEVAQEAWDKIEENLKLGRKRRF